MQQIQTVEAQPQTLARRRQRWALWRDIPFAIIGWFGVMAIIFWLATHFAQALLIAVVAGLLAYALAPLVGLAERVMPRPLAITLIVLVIYGGFGTIAALAVRTAIDQASGLANQIAHFDPQYLSDILRRIGLTQTQIDNLGSAIINQVQSATGNLVALVLGTATLLLDTLITLVISIYFLADGPRLNRWLRTQMPGEIQPRITYLVGTLEQVVGGYIRGQLVLAALIGLLVGSGMWVIGLPYALLIGVLAFLLEFIPYMGTLTSGAICVAIGLTLGWVTAVIVLVYFIVVHILEGYVIGPRVIGPAVGIHPALALIALVAGAEAFGVFGALFAAPVAGVLQALIITVWRNYRYAVPGQDLLTPAPDLVLPPTT